MQNRVELISNASKAGMAVPAFNVPYSCLKECVESLPPSGIEITSFRAVGGSRSDAWVQTCSDILRCPFVRSTAGEAGALGAAIIVGVGNGVFGSLAEEAEAMVYPERAFELNCRRQARCESRFGQYKSLWPLMQEYLRCLAAEQR